MKTTEWNWYFSAFEVVGSCTNIIQLFIQTNNCSKNLNENLKAQTRHREFFQFFSLLVRETKVWYPFPTEYQTPLTSAL